MQREKTMLEQWLRHVHVAESLPVGTTQAKAVRSMRRITLRPRAAAYPATLAPADSGTHRSMNRLARLSKPKRALILLAAFAAIAAADLIC